MPMKNVQKYSAPWMFRISLGSSLFNTSNKEAAPISEQPGESGFRATQKPLAACNRQWTNRLLADDTLNRGNSQDRRTCDE